MTIYLSGPMTGLPDHNYPAFRAAAERLRAQGTKVISPHELPANCPGCSDEAMPHSWANHMRADLAALLTCDVIMLLPGWEQSRGAQLEKTVAEAVNMMVVDYRLTTSESLPPRPQPSASQGQTAP